MRERFADADGRLRATFEIVWLSGWAPHESQQKPLKPGSATQRLADALGTQGNIDGRKAGGASLAERVGDRRSTCLTTDTPSALTATMMAPAMPAAISAYSMAVAPLLVAQEVAQASGSFRDLLMDASCSFVDRPDHSSAIRCEISGTSAGGIS